MLLMLLVLAAAVGAPFIIFSGSWVTRLSLSGCFSPDDPPPPRLIFSSELCDENNSDEKDDTAMTDENEETSSEDDTVAREAIVVVELCVGSIPPPPPPAFRLISFSDLTEETAMTDERDALSSPDDAVVRELIVTVELSCSCDDSVNCSFAAVVLIWPRLWVW